MKIELKNISPDNLDFIGSALPLNGMKYYWRIKLWDDEDNEGPWTNGKDYFVMAGKRIQDLSYTYDNVGNITQIIDESETYTKKMAEYAYDDLYRLTSICKPPALAGVTRKALSVPLGRTFRENF